MNRKMRVNKQIGIAKIVVKQEKLPSRYFNKKAFKAMEQEIQWDAIDNYLTLKNIGGV